MRNKVFAILLFFCFSMPVLAQRVDYKRIILPDNAAEVSFEERLVQLAWKNNPASSIASKEVQAAQYEYKAVGVKWAGIFGAQGNLNELSIKELTGDQQSANNLFYPRYNFSLNVPLSIFFEVPIQKKVAQTRIDVAEERINLLKLDIRAKVLMLYNEYKMNETIWNIRKTAVADEESNYLLVEQKFRTGEITIEEYMRAQKSRNELNILNAQAENDYLKSKLELEAIIGVKLEEVQ